MSKKKKWEDEVLEAAAMKLRRDGVNQSDIAKMLGRNLKQSTISRMEANSKYLTREWHAIPPDGFDKQEFLDAVDTLTGGQEIRKKLRTIANDATMKVDVLLQDDPPTVTNRGFGPNVARMLSRLIERVERVGFTWGPEILPPNVLHQNFVLRDRSVGDKPISFVPLCGISGGPNDILTISSTVVAMRFDALVNRGYSTEERDLYNLNCIPLRLPGKNGKAIQAWESVNEEVRAYIQNAFPDYEDIHGSMLESNRKAKPGIIDNIDMIVSSLGSNGETAERLLKLLFGENPIQVRRPGKKIISIEQEKLRKENIVGDIAGILLPSDEGKDPEYNRFVVDYLNSQLATLRSNHLLECRERAKIDAIEKLGTDKDSKPGVVVIALGSERCDALLTAIKMGYVSRVIISKDMEKEILSSN